MEVEKLLTAGAITQILDNQTPTNPVLQIIGYKPMTPDQMSFGQVTDELRYRLMISDGVRTHQYCVITNQDIVEDIKCGKLEKWSIIRVTSYQTADYGDGPSENERRLIYILNLELVMKGSEVGHKIIYPEPTEHKIQQISQQSLTFDELGKYLNIDPNDAHIIVAQLIREEKIKGHIDQLEKMVYFDNKDILQTFDEEIKNICSEVNTIIEKIRVLEPDWWAANAL